MRGRNDSVCTACSTNRNQLSTPTPIILGFSFLIEFWTIISFEPCFGHTTADDGVHLRLRGGSGIRTNDLSGHATYVNLSAATTGNNCSVPANIRLGHPAKRRRPDEDCQQSIPPPHLDSDIPIAKKNDNGEIYFEVMLILNLTTIYGERPIFMAGMMHL